MKTIWNNRQYIFIDTPLLSGLLILSGVGLIILYSAGGQNWDLIIRQVIRIAIGFTVMIVLAQIRIQLLKEWIPWIYLAGVIFLIGVLAVGEISKGSQRWLDLGIIRFQPSEMMKLAVPLMVIWYLADKPLPANYTRIWIALMIIIVPVLLIAKQPDLGTAILIAASGIFVLYLAGLQWQLIIKVLALTPVAIWIIWQFMYDYQKTRVLTLFDPEKNASTSGYHIIQSKIAIGSGGLYGKGWLNGTQSNLEFLPERTTDFIFAVLSEEFGLLGVILLLSIYLFIITRGTTIALQAQGTFSQLLAGSVVLTFFVYIMVNMGMVSGILPVVGVPLPLISYGGTSIVTLMASFGLLMAIHAHRPLLSN